VLVQLDLTNKSLYQCFLKNIELITKQIDLVAIQLRIIKVAINNITKQIKSIESRFRFRTDSEIEKSDPNNRKTEELVHYSKHKIEYWKSLLPNVDWDENGDASGIKVEPHHRQGSRTRVHLLRNGSLAKSFV